MISVLIADDHQLFRQGLVAMLKEHAQFKVMGEAANGAVAGDQRAISPPDVLLLDI